MKSVFAGLKMVLLIFIGELSEITKVQSTYIALLNRCIGLVIYLSVHSLFLSPWLGLRVSKYFPNLAILIVLHVACS